MAYEELSAPAPHAAAPAEEPRETQAASRLALRIGEVDGIHLTRRGEELARDIRTTDCRLLVTEQAYAPLLAGLDHGARAVLDASEPAYADRLERARSDRTALPTEAAPDPATRLLLLFTSCCHHRPGRVAASRAWTTSSSSGCCERWSRCPPVGWSATATWPRSWGRAHARWDR